MEEDLRSLLSAWGSQPPEAVDPRNAASTSVSDGSSHPAAAASTPQIWPKTLGGVKASGFLSGPLLYASRRRRELEGSAGGLGGAEGLGAEPRGAWGGARGGERSIAGSGLGAELAPRGRVQSDPKLGRTRCRWAAGKNTSLSQG